MLSAVTTEPFSQPAFISSSRWCPDSSTQSNQQPAPWNLHAVPQEEFTNTQHFVINGSRLPPSALAANYLALVMLCRSLEVSSERSEGTRISTGLIFRTRASTSERDGPSGKQSSNTSPVLGWTAYKQTHGCQIKSLIRAFTVDQLPTLSRLTTSPTVSCFFSLSQVSLIHSRKLSGGSETTSLEEPSSTSPSLQTGFTS